MSSIISQVSSTTKPERASPQGQDIRSPPAPSPSASTSAGTPSEDSSIGTTDVHPSSASNLSSTAFWPFAEALASRETVHIPALPGYVVEGFENRGWDEPAREAVLIPISVEGAYHPAAVLVLGLNSRRPYDEEYQNFIDLFRLAMSSLLFAVRRREADVIRAECVCLKKLKTRANDSCTGSSPS